MLGAENVYRTSKARGPLTPVPKLLVETRLEEENARNAGMPQSAPKQYQVRLCPRRRPQHGSPRHRRDGVRPRGRAPWQFIKESLDALEREYAAKARRAPLRPPPAPAPAPDATAAPRARIATQFES